MTYQPADTPAGVVITTVLAARAFADTFPPLVMPAPHWALRVASTQPVAVAVVGYKQGTSLDHWFAYRGEAYVPPQFRVYLPASLLNTFEQDKP
jgi:hypothetical protein